MFQLFFVTKNIGVGTIQANLFEQVMESFTQNIAPDGTSADRIRTTCEFQSGTLVQGDRYLRSGHRRLQDEQLQVFFRYSMEYRSDHVNVTEFDQYFKNWANSNLGTVVAGLATAGVPVLDAQPMFILDDSDAPTIHPSRHPTLSPSSRPSRIPTFSPSNYPSKTPSKAPSDIPSVIPSDGPSLQPSIGPTELPSVTPTVTMRNRGSNQTTTIAAVVASIGAGALIFAVGICFRRRRNIDDDRPPRSPLPLLMPGLRPRPNQPSRVPSRHDAFPIGTPNDDVNRNPLGGLPDDRSVRSRSSNSLISTGSSHRNDSGSDIAYEESYNFQDEFDQYKDQNLEKMRTNVENMSTNFDGMMSQALTNALMDDMDEDDENFGDFTADMQSSMDIEATVLCDMNDWIKQTEGALPDER